MKYGHEFHRPVMADEVAGWMTDKAPAAPGRIYVDATVGGGGHAEVILRSSGPGSLLIGIDRDQDAVFAAKARLACHGDRVKVVRGRFGEIGKLLDSLGVTSVDGILADLGVSSFQLDSAHRGFSFTKEGPLDMRMDVGDTRCAADMLEGLTEDELVAILKDYGEERFAGRIAKAIVRHGGGWTTTELAKVVASSYPRGARHGRINAATRTFQALRIAVNDEIGELERFMDEAPVRLKMGGRLVIISYHSLEDRSVKHTFRKFVAGGEFVLPVRRAITPSADEVRHNRRARSAKLRVLERAL